MIDLALLISIHHLTSHDKDLLHFLQFTFHLYNTHSYIFSLICAPLKKWCREGSCIDMDPDPDRDRVVMHATASDLNSIEKKKEDIASIDGRWSSWSSWTPCSSECIIRSDHSATIGISWSTRKCNTPSPLNGGKLCDGNDKMAKLCDASQVSLQLSLPSPSTIPPINIFVSFFTPAVVPFISCI